MKHVILLSNLILLFFGAAPVNAKSNSRNHFQPTFACVDEDGTRLEIKIITSSPRPGYIASASKGIGPSKLNYRGEYIWEDSGELRSYTFLMHRFSGSLNDNDHGTLNINLSADLVTLLAKGHYEEDGSAGMYSKAIICKVD